MIIQSPSGVKRDKLEIQIPSDRRFYFLRLLTIPERIAFVFLITLFLVVILVPLTLPYSAEQQNFDDGLLLPPGSANHILGTDQLARDLLSRLLLGARVSLSIALGSVAIGLVVGAIIGITAGYRGGWMNTTLMRVMDSLQAFPTMVLALVIAAGLGPSYQSTVIAISVVMVPGFARVSRTLTLRERDKDYVLASRVAGAKGIRITTTQVMPNIWAPLAAQAAVAFAHAIPGEAALSFLGLGVQPPTPSWGNMMADGYAYISLSPWPIIAPAVALALTVASVSIFSDGLQRTSGEEH